MKIIVIMLVFLMLGCKGKTDEQVEYVMDKQGVVEGAGISMDRAPVSRQAMVQAAPADEMSNLPEVSSQKLIKDGRMQIQAKDIQSLKWQVDSMLKSFAAYYGQESYQDNEYETSFSLLIRVPSEQFEPLVAALEAGTGKVLFKDIAARDVTQQFIDLEARLKSKREYLARYSDLLSRAQSVKDILEIEGQIRMLMEEIDSTEGRLQYLNDQVSYSSLHLTLTREKVFSFQPDKRDRMPDRLKQSLLKGWIGLLDVLLFLVKLWPVYILIAVVAIFRRFR